MKSLSFRYLMLTIRTRMKCARSFFFCFFFLLFVVRNLKQFRQNSGKTQAKLRQNSIVLLCCKYPMQ